MAQTVKCLPAMWETRVRSLGQEDPPEREMATHSSILAWKIPWTEEPGGLQSMGLQSVRRNQTTSLSLLEGKLPQKNLHREVSINRNSTLNHHVFESTTFFWQHSCGFFFPSKRRPVCCSTWMGNRSILLSSSAEKRFAILGVCTETVAGHL